MSALILPGSASWFDMVSPHPDETESFFKKAGTGWRTPKRLKEQMWRLRAGEFRGPRKQRGFMQFVGMWHEPAGGGGTEPNLQTIVDEYSVVAPNISRISLAYDSDGSIVADLDCGAISTIVYAALTTNSDDTNDHTNDWWPDQPDTNEGLNWDIRYTNDTSGGTVTNRWYFYDTVGVAHRVVDTWYLLDTVSNDHLDASAHGALGVNRSNGTAKAPTTGVGDITVDVEIRATGSGSAVASHNVALSVRGT